MLLRYALLICATLLGLSSLSAAGQERKTVGYRTYDLAQHGALQLTVPLYWNDELRRSGVRPGLPTIFLTPEHGDSFNVQITPLYEATPPTLEAIGDRVRELAVSASLQVMESTITLKEIKGTSGAGYYFNVTDRAPKPEEFKFMTQGVLRVGELLLAFTILSNDGAEAAVSNTLKMLREARLKPTFDR